jgi:glucan phosphoethanolaminetransferase (alkaline phosphatase superfamily)
MYNYLTKNGQLVAFLIGLVVIVIFLGSVISGLSSGGYDMGTDLNALDADVKKNINFFNPGLYLTALLGALTAALAFVVFGVWNLIKFPKDAIKFVAGIAGLLVIFFILYSMSNVETAGKLGELHDELAISDGTSKFISGAMKTAMGLAVVSFVAMFAGELRNMFK